MLRPQKKEKENKVKEKSESLRNIRERIRARLFKTSSLPPQDILRPKDITKHLKNRLEGRISKFRLRLFFTVKKPTKPIQKITQTQGRGKAPRIYVYRDQLSIRQTKAVDSGVYTCQYRGKERIVWTITVLRPGVEPYRYVAWPHAQLALDNRELTTDNASISPNLRLLRPKTLLNANIEVFTMWAPWSNCVPCVSDLLLFETLNVSGSEIGGEGFQMRVGTCYLKTLDPFYPIRPYRLAREANRELRKYKESGLPCRSHLIVEGVENSGIKGLRKRPSEILIRPCTRPCRKPKSLPPYTFKENFRGMDVVSSKQAANDISKPIFKKRRAKDGERLILSCPIRGTVHSPISWFRLPADMQETINFTKNALSESTFSTVGIPAAWVALWMEQVNLSELVSESRGRIMIDPGYNLIFNEIRTGVDMTIPPGRRIPVMRFACIHGDARGDNFKLSDFSGVISVEAIIRWRYLYIITGMSKLLGLIMPGILSIFTIFITIRSYYIEKKPIIAAAAQGHSQRAKI